MTISDTRVDVPSAIVLAQPARAADLELLPPPARESGRWLRIVIPIVVAILVVGYWEWVVAAYDIKPYILPAPSRIMTTFGTDFPVLWASLLVTLSTTFKGLLLAFLGGVGLAVLFSQSRIIEYAFYPYAVILQVTPVLAVAPLLLIYLDQGTAVLACAWIVAFFPILSNTVLGLRSVDRNLQDLFKLYGAGPWQTLWQLKMKAALPYLLGGLKIGGGLALIGAVVAEIAAGSAGAGSGLAYRIVESQYRLNIPRLFAALIMLAAAGVVIFLGMSALSDALLRKWHESALKGER